MTPTRRLILGSTSPYRRELLSRLGWPFACEPPAVDEAPAAGESPRALAIRLAAAKAHEVAARFPDAIVIGSDQVADLDGQPVGKPGDHARAVAQLTAASGRSLSFHTAVHVVCRATGFEAGDCVSVQVRFRALSAAEIESYLRRERPYDCAGSAKSEGLGIALLEALEGSDPTALVGLPLIRTCHLLRQAGLDPLADPTATPA